MEVHVYNKGFQNTQAICKITPYGNNVGRAVRPITGAYLCPAIRGMGALKELDLASVHCFGTLPEAGG